ncbi:hypothetical protein HD553DRAFT_343440 [Filobasidium floriforme]|uniref:uncharacterized protein n=1 Tax=Filobasidium floriforme TaxID=5210 RepID=UPI001E8E79ED|nr:uncharacterized protein HD553DRAFT_343440 [Filobasidium floriforme]KAH8082679.1 hypothetical protein HD553DRAFT_343440 [Filobasidium floriforme]
MPPRRPNRTCYCPACSSSGSGFKSVAYITWRRHNPPGHEHFPAPPAAAAAAPLTVNPLDSPSGPLPTLSPVSAPAPLPPLFDEIDGSLPDLPAVIGAGGPSSPPPITPAGLTSDDDDVDMYDWNHDYPVDADDDASSMGQPLGSDRPPSEGPLPNHDDAFEDEIAWTFPPNDPIAQYYSTEPDPARPGRQVVRINIENLQRHHALPSHLRQIYTAIAYGKATGMPNVPANTILQQMTSLAEACLEEEIEDRTYNVRTAQSRLGVLPDDYISRWICCPNNECWLLTPYAELYQLDGEACPDCGTELYRINNNIRTPHKVMPTMALSISLALLLQDRDVLDNLQNWREKHPEDDLVAPGDAEPLDKERPFLDPKETMHDISDGAAWRYGLAGGRRYVDMDNRAHDRTEHPQEKRHVGQYHGLQIVINCDWFAVKGVIGSSVGVVYAAIANLPIHMRYKKRYTAILGVIPGPKEPPGLCFNKALEPIVRDLQLCERGFKIELPRFPDAFVSAQVLLISCDLPAARKMTGAMGLSHKNHPCPHCGITLEQVNDLEGYDWRHLPEKPGTPAETLQAGFEYEIAGSGRRYEIEQRNGVRFTALSRLCGFEVSDSAPTDPLHNSFLGLVKSFMNMILKSDLFDGDIDGESRIDIFRTFFEDADYPGHLGRLPNYAIGQLIRQSHGAMRTPTRSPTKFFWSIEVWDEGELEAEEEVGVEVEGGAEEEELPCHGMRPPSATGVNVAPEAGSAVEDIANAARTILALNGRLTINWHIAMHYVRFIHLYGPVSGFGCWAFERHNGALSNVKHNGKVDLPTTLIRAWIREFRLSAIINNPAPDAGVIEVNSLEALRQDPARGQGTLMLQEARGNVTPCRLSNIYQPAITVDLERRGIYGLLLDFFQIHHPNLNFIDAAHIMDNRPSLPKWGSCYQLYTHMFQDGLKFGSCLYARSERDRHALIVTDQDRGISHLAQVQLFLKVKITRSDPGRSVDMMLALVDFYEPHGSIGFPWQEREVDLGMRIYKNRVRGRVFVPASSIRAATTVSLLQTADEECLLSMSCDKEGTETEYELE